MGTFLASRIATRFQVSWPTVKRWVDRYRAGDTIYQRVAAGGVNWVQVGVSVALGGIGGAELGAVRAASTNGMWAVAASSLVNGAVGGGASTLAYGLGHDGSATVRGYVGFFAGGFVAGGISGVAGPEGGTIAEALTG